VIAWLGKKLILYDNSIVKSSERNAILERFQLAQKHYGCKLFVVDNLMSAHIPIDKERDYYRAQSNFVGELVEFSLQTKSHVILVSHPRKESSGDRNDDVAGSADITNRAHNVLWVARATDKEAEMYHCDALIYVTKNREYGDTGMTPFGFDKPTRRFTLPDGKAIENYGWEDEV